MFNWLANLFQGRDKLRGHVPHVGAVAVHNSFSSHDPVEAGAQSGTYALSPWVYVAVNRIAEAAALVPLKVYQVVGGEERVEVDAHPLEKLLDTPNPFSSGFELIEATVGTLELTGNAFWFLAGDASGTPAEIWPLRPDRLRIVPDRERYIKGYLYEIDGQQIPLEAVEVVHFKRWHPGNDYYGLSALSPARAAVTTDRAMSEWNRNTFGSGNGVPAGIVNIKDFVSDTDFERIKREWRLSYGSAQRRTAFLRGGGMEWQNIGLNHTDMDFLQGRQANRDEILNIFGVPVGLVSDNATEANAKVAERLFIERTLWPKLTRIAAKLTTAILPFYPGNHVAAFEDIRPTDQAARMDEIRTAYPILSINELRERYFRLPSVEWGAVPVGSQGSKIIDMPPDENTADDRDGAKSTDAGILPLDELAQWERFALKRLGQPESRPFRVHALPDEIAFEVAAGVAGADDADTLKSVFADARALLESDATSEVEAVT